MWLPLKGYETMRKESRGQKIAKHSFSIGSTNEVSMAVDSRLDGKITFASERELGLRTADWPGSRFVEVWNKLPNVKRITKFKSRGIAIRRIWRAIQDGKAGQTSDTRSTKIDAIEAGRPLTKTDEIINLLKQSGGATLRSLMQTTGWQAHSVRGFISAQLSKKRGFRIQSFTRDGERVYRIRG
jgi:hypothetical protein